MGVFERLSPAKPMIRARGLQHLCKQPQRALPVALPWPATPLSSPRSPTPGLGRACTPSGRRAADSRPDTHRPLPNAWYGRWGSPTPCGAVLGSAQAVTRRPSSSRPQPALRRPRPQSRPSRRRRPNSGYRQPGARPPIGSMQVPNLGPTGTRRETARTLGPNRVCPMTRAARLAVRLRVQSASPPHAAPSSIVGPAQSWRSVPVRDRTFKRTVRPRLIARTCLARRASRYTKLSVGPLTQSEFEIIRTS